MSKRFEAKGAGIPDTEGSMRGWYSYQLFEGMKCFPEDLGEGLSATYLYPEPADLRKRLAALEADPTPIVESLKRWYCLPEEQGIDPFAQIPWVLQRMHEFVDCYEKAFANKTEWGPMYRLVSEEDVVDDYLEEETDSALPPDADGPTSSEDGKSLPGQSVEWGDPSLMKPRCEKVPGKMHREPYIVLS